MLTALRTHPCALIFTNRHPASNWTPWSLDASTSDSRVGCPPVGRTLGARANLSTLRYGRVAETARTRGISKNQPREIGQGGLGVPGSKPSAGNRAQIYVTLHKCRLFATSHQ